MSLLLVTGACQPDASVKQTAPEAVVAPPSQQEAIGPPPKSAPLPPPTVYRDNVMDPKGVTAEQAALDVACKRRSQLPRATPVPSQQAADATGRAVISGGKLTVGRFSFEPRDESDVEGEGYRYAGKYAAADVDIILADVDLGIGWRVVEQGAGELAVPHLLIPSPDGKVWVTSTDWEGEFGKVTFYRIDPHQWTKLAEISVDYACDLHWFDALTVAFRTGEKADAHRRIANVDGQWVLQAAE